MPAPACLYSALLLSIRGGAAERAPSPIGEVSVIHRRNLLVLALLVSTSGGFASPHVAHPSPRAVIVAKFAAVNRHDIPGIVKLYAPDAEINASDYCKPRAGQAEVQRNYESLFSAYPDIAVDVSEYIAEGDRVAILMKVSVHVNGQIVDVPIADFFTVRNGRIASDDARFDVHGRPCSS